MDFICFILGQIQSKLRNWTGLFSKVKQQLVQLRDKESIIRKEKTPNDEYS